MTTMVDNLRVSSGAANEIFLTDSPSSYFESADSFAEALRKNNSLVSVHLGPDFLNNLTKKDATTVLQRFGSLPSLKEFHVSHGKISVQALTSLLENASQIEVLEIVDTTLKGTDEEYETLVSAIHKSASIKELSLVNARFTPGATTSNTILKALDKHQALRILKLAPHREDQQTLSSSLLLKVLQSSSLKELYLSHFVLGQLHIGVISWALDHSDLKVLELPDTGFSDILASRLSASLGNSSLEHLDVSHNDKLTSEGTSLIAKSLMKNSHMKVLRLSGCKHIGLGGVAALAEMAGESVSLERLDIPTVVDQTVRTSGVRRQMKNSRAKAA